MSSSNDGLKSALENWDHIYQFKARFIEENQDEDGGEPLCGYEDWDEYMTDINYDLAEMAEHLVEAVREYLK